MSKLLRLKGLLSFLAAFLYLTVQTLPLQAFIPNRAYVLNGAGNSVAVVDTLSNTIVNTIPVGAFPVSLALSPAADTAYVANSFSFPRTVSVVDLLTETLITNLSVTGSPVSVAITPDGTKAFVALSSNDTIEVFDAINHMPITSFSISPAGDNPSWVTVSPDGAKLYVTSANTNEVLVYDTSSYTLLAQIAVGNNPSYIAITPDGTKAYVTNTAAPIGYTIIDTATNDPSSVFPFASTQGSPNNIVITPDGLSVYVTSTASGIPQRIDVNTNVSSDVIGAPAIGQGMAINPIDPTVIYYAGANSTAILSTIDTTTNTYTGTAVSGFSFPTRLAFSPASIPEPATDFVGRSSKNKFLTQTDRINHLSWHGSPSTNVVSYRLSRNGVVIANYAASPVVPGIAGVYSYDDHNRIKGVQYIYTLVAISDTGFESDPLTVIMQ